MAIISKKIDVKPSEPKMYVSLSADVEFLVDEASKQRTSAQEVLKTRFRSLYSPDLQKSCIERFKKGSSYSFHVCFVTTKDIKSDEHRDKIRCAFVEIVKKYISKIAFHPHEFRAYIIQEKDGTYHDGRSPDKSPIVLVPKNPEDFKKINQELAVKLEEFNTLWGTKYELDDDLVPRHYTPHITIINRPDLRNLVKTIGKTKQAVLEQLNASVPKETFSLKDHNYKV